MYCQTISANSQMICDLLNLLTQRILNFANIAISFIDAVLVPIVLLVLEGGPGTLETVHQAIANNTPTVLVKGSGRAADILAYAYQNAKEEEFDAQDREGKKQKT